MMPTVHSVDLYANDPRSEHDYQTWCGAADFDGRGRLTYVSPTAVQEIGGASFRFLRVIGRQVRNGAEHGRINHPAIAGFRVTWETAD